MRIMQVMAGATHGGAEEFFTRLVLALKRAHLQQLVVIRRNGERARRLDEGGVTPVELSFGGRLDLLTGYNLKRRIEDFKPDIVMTWMNRATAMCPQGDFVHVARLGGYYDLKYYQNCDHLIGNTEDIVRYIVASGWPEEKAHYLPNFVDGQSVPPISRASLYTPESAKVLVAMGRLHENKAFDVLLRAMAQLPDVYLWLAGDGPLSDELQALASKLGVKPRVRFLGWRDDTAALLAAGDVFVCPSRHEPLGNVVVEAWAHGVPCIAAAADGPAALIEDGVTGLLVPVDDVDALAHAMSRVLGDGVFSSTLAAAGRAEYESRFTETRVIKRYLDFFKAVAR